MDQGGAPMNSPDNGASPSHTEGRKRDSDSGSAFKRFQAAGPGPGSEALAAASMQTRARRQSGNLVAKTTVGLVDTYASSNRQFAYSFNANPKRVLTKPSEGTKNDGYDNENSDYILYVGDSLINQQPSSGISRTYVVKEMLGQGTFGQVASCWCEEQQRMIAVKVIKNKPEYYHQARVEIGILQLLNTRFDAADEHHLVRMTDFFLFRKHLCICFEQLHVDLFELLKRNAFRGLSLNLVELFVRQILDSLAVLRDARIIHCDLKPENILLKNAHSGEIKTIDFGSACFDNRTVYSYIQSRFYRAPEVVLGTTYTAAIDMWSLGCVAAELFLGLPLFPGASEHDLLTRVVDIIGMPPSWLMTEAKHTDKFFRRRLVQGLVNPAAPHGVQHVLMTQSEFEYENSCKAPIGKRYFKHSSIPDIVTAYPMKSTLGDDEVAKERKHRESFIDFLVGVLDMDPRTRWTPRQAAAHPFVKGTPFKGPFQPPQDVRVHPAMQPQQAQKPQQPMDAVSLGAHPLVGKAPLSAATAAAAAAANPQVILGTSHEASTSTALHAGSMHSAASISAVSQQLLLQQQQQSAQAQAHAIAMATLQHLGPKLGFNGVATSATGDSSAAASVTDILFLGASLPTTSFMSNSLPFDNGMAPVEPFAANLSRPLQYQQQQQLYGGQSHAMMVPQQSLAHPPPLTKQQLHQQQQQAVLQQHWVQLGATPSMSSFLSQQAAAASTPSQARAVAAAAAAAGAAASGSGLYGNRGPISSMSMSIAQGSTSMNIALGKHKLPAVAALVPGQSFPGGQSLAGNFLLGGLSPADYQHAASQAYFAAMQPPAPALQPQQQLPPPAFQQPMPQFGFNIPSHPSMQQQQQRQPDVNMNAFRSGSRLSPMEEGDGSSPVSGMLPEATSTLTGAGAAPMDKAVPQHQQQQYGAGGVSHAQLASTLGFSKDQIGSDSPEPNSGQDTDMGGNDSGSMLRALTQSPGDWDPLNPLFYEDQLLEEGSKHGNNDAAAALKLCGGDDRSPADLSAYNGAGNIVSSAAPHWVVDSSGMDGATLGAAPMASHPSGQGPRMMRLGGPHSATAMDIGPVAGMEGVEDEVPSPRYLSFSLPYSGVLPPAGHLLPPTALQHSSNNASNSNGGGNKP